MKKMFIMIFIVSLVFCGLIADDREKPTKSGVTTYISFRSGIGTLGSSGVFAYGTALGVDMHGGGRLRVRPELEFIWGYAENVFGGSLKEISTPDPEFFVEADVITKSYLTNICFDVLLGDGQSNSVYILAGLGLEESRSRADYKHITYTNDKVGSTGFGSQRYNYVSNLGFGVAFRMSDKLMGDFGVRSKSVKINIDQFKDSEISINGVLFMLSVRHYF